MFLQDFRVPFLLLWTYECVPLIFVACFPEFRYKTTNAHLVTVPQHMSLGVILSVGMHDMCKIGKTAEGSSTSHPTYVTD
jgi:hypothetical protein